jgi:hypothetical protein
MISTKSQALIYAEEHTFSHDISHCSPENVKSKCHECKRYAAYLQNELNLNKEDTSFNLYSYLGSPEADCMKQDFQLFLPLN